MCTRRKLLLLPSLSPLNFSNVVKFGGCSRALLLVRENAWCLSAVGRRKHMNARIPVRVYSLEERIPSRKNRLITVVQENAALGKVSGQEWSNKSAEKSARREASLRSAHIYKEVMSEALNKDTRKLIVLEGERLVEEAFKANLKISHLFIKKTLKIIPARLISYVEKSNVTPHYISEQTIQTWSVMTTPPGIIGVFHKPKPGNVSFAKPIIPLTVICDNVREPGNLGSILRTAAASGCKSVLLSKGCCDPWETKVLRGGCGAQFYLPITMNYPFYSLTEYMQLENSGGEGMGEGSDLTRQDGNEKDDYDEAGNCNESKGEYSSSGVTPKSSQENSPSSFALFLADNNDSEGDGQKHLPIVSYTDVDYRAFGNVYLAVGGETEGLSPDILQIAARLETIHPRGLKSTVARLRIPLFHSMESLNAASAFSVIAYEILRQYQQSNLLPLSPQHSN